LTVVGCGDAFGSGGRLQTCLHVASGDDEFLIDCGATTLTGINRLGIDLNRVSAIFLTHLHGDHFGGLPFLLLHAQFVSRRTAPLTVWGPLGTEARVLMAAEALFPGSTTTRRKFTLQFGVYVERQPFDAAGATVTPHEVLHASGAPPYALRFAIEGKVLAATGDTEWVEAIVTAGAGADLLIAECYGFKGVPKYHLSWQQIAANLDRIGARRVLLTHMSTATLARAGEIRDARVLLADDGMRLDI